VIAVLADHNVEGQAALLWSALGMEGWLDLFPLRLVHFRQVDLPLDSSDRDIWPFAQDHQMLLLTGNRDMADEDSLEQTIQQENQPTSLPVITISRSDRMVETTYRQQCATRLAEIVLYLGDYLGTGRLYIP
jgi:hypothetical protein